MPRAISTSPAPPASTTPALRRTSSSSGVRARASSPRARTARRSSGGGRRRCSFRSLSSAISRMTVSIVPSTGRFTARYAVSLASRKARLRSDELDALVLTEHLDEATDDLREDDARVPTRAHQRRTGHVLRDCLAVRRPSTRPAPRRSSEASGRGWCPCPRPGPGRRSGRRCDVGAPPGSAVRCARGGGRGRAPSVRPDAFASASRERHDAVALRAGVRPRSARSQPATRRSVRARSSRSRTARAPPREPTTSAES